MFYLVPEIKTFHICISLSREVTNGKETKIDSQQPEILTFYPSQDFEWNKTALAPTGICTYIRMCVCAYVRMYVCTYVHMYVVRMDVCKYVRMYVCTYVCKSISTYVCMYVSPYVRMYVCMYFHLIF